MYTRFYAEENAGSATVSTGSLPPSDFIRSLMSKRTQNLHRLMKGK